jgi:hypothetical protein
MIDTDPNTNQQHNSSTTAAVRWAAEQEDEITETHDITPGDPYCRFEYGEVKG